MKKSGFVSGALFFKASATFTCPPASKRPKNIKQYQAKKCKYIIVTWYTCCTWYKDAHLSRKNTIVMSSNVEDGCKMDARWMQDGCKMDARWMQAHAWSCERKNKEKPFKDIQRCSWDLKLLILSPELTGRQWISLSQKTCQVGHQSFRTSPQTQQKCLRNGHFVVVWSNIMSETGSHHSEIFQECRSSRWISLDLLTSRKIRKRPKKSQEWFGVIDVWKFVMQKAQRLTNTWPGLYSRSPANNDNYPGRPQTMQLPKIRIPTWLPTARKTWVFFPRKTPVASQVPPQQNRPSWCRCRKPHAILPWCEGQQCVLLCTSSAYVCALRTSKSSVGISIECVEHGGLDARWQCWHVLTLDMLCIMAYPSCCTPT